jgi:hypothetical protein
LALVNKKNPYGTGKTKRHSARCAALNGTERTSNRAKMRKSETLPMNISRIFRGSLHAKPFGIICCFVALTFGAQRVDGALQFGNNFYDFVSVVDPFSGENNSWFAAKTAASTRVFNGVNGHLATITSQAENDFLYGLVTGQYTGFKGAWIGAKSPDGWLVGPENGQAFSYMNWGGVEPNDGGYTYMQIGNSSGFKPRIHAARQSATETG